MDMKRFFCIFGVVLLIAGLLIFVLSEKASIGIIGGADGPTVLFITGKSCILFVAAGILLIIVSCVFLLKKKK